MDWKVVSLLPFFMWAGYAVLGSVASRTHGESVTMVGESVAMLMVGIYALTRVSAGDLEAMTKLSGTQALLMGLLSAGGVLVQLYAFRIAPADHQGTVVMLGGMFPVLAVVIFHVMAATKITGGSPATFRQWLGVVACAAGLWLVSSKEF